MSQDQVSQTVDQVSQKDCGLQYIARRLSVSAVSANGTQCDMSAKPQKAMNSRTSPGLDRIGLLEI